MMHIKTTVFILAGLMALPGLAVAETAKGRIKYISNKANTIQLDIKGKEPVVVRFDKNTAFENAANIDDLGPPDLLKVEYEPGKPASKITKVVFGLPPGVEIDMQEMLAILQGKRGEYLLGDARPARKFPGGHIPSAVSTFPNDKEAFLKALPEDKSRLLVFYCGGPTCPFTGKAVKAAMEAGYTNIKGFQEGIPGWKKAKLAVHSEPAWLAKNLDEHHVIIDARATTESTKQHIQSAVAMPASRLEAMTRQFIKTQAIAGLPGVTDMGAPIVVYANKHTDRNALLAYKQLRDWGYSNASILVNGFDGWTGKGLPVASGPAATAIVYTKKLAKGAIPPKEFAALEQSREGIVFLDVRSDAEIAKLGMLKGATHLPLDNLEASLASVPKDKEIVTYCENGIRAEMAYEKLKEHGYKARFLNETLTFDKAGNYKF
jgi:rhodanese-related sulfurtransferase